MTTRFTFDRRGDVVGDVRGAHVVFMRDGVTLLGEVREWFRDEDETPRLRVQHFNGESWPVEPPAALVQVLVREYEKGAE